MNIVFDHIKLQGFLSLGEVDIDLNSQGLVLINGVNNTSEGTKSNGAGKSSIFDGIVWVLTGNTIRGSSDVENMYLNKGSYGQLTLYIDEKQFIITRTKHHYELGSSLSIVVDGEDKSGDGLKKSSQLLEEYLGSLDYSILSSVIILGQGLPNKFSSLSPASRKDMLENLSKSSEFVDNTKLKLTKYENECKANLNKLEQELSSNKGSAASLKSTLTKLQEDLDNYSLDKVIKDIEDHQSKLSDTQSKLDACLSQLKILDDKFYQEVTDPMSKAKEEKTKLTYIQSTYLGELSSLKSHVGVCPTCLRKLDNEDQYLTKIKEVESNLAQINNKLSIIDNYINKLQSISTELSSSRTSLNNEYSLLNIEHAKLTSELDKLEVIKSSGDSLSSRCSEIKVQIMELSEISERLSSEINEGTNNLNAISYLLREVSRDFRSYLLEDIILYLNQLLSKYSQYFYNNDSIEILLKNNKVWIGYEGRSYENLSGGESHRVDLAIQFALRDMMIHTTGFSCNLLAIDECFDGLDSIGCENLVKLVTTELSDLNSIFFITHHADITIPYDRSITINKNPPGISYVN